MSLYDRVIVTEGARRLSAAEKNILGALADYQRASTNSRGMPAKDAESAYEERVLDRLHDLGLVDYMDWGGETYYRVRPEGYKAIKRKPPAWGSKAKWPPPKAVS